MLKLDIHSLNRFCAMLLSVVLVGCGGSAPPAPAPAPAPAPKPAAPIVVQPPEPPAPAPTARVVPAGEVVAQPDLYLLNQPQKTNYQITFLPGQSPRDFFSVKLAPPSTNSTNYKVTAVPPPAATTPRNPLFIVPTGYTELPEYGNAEDGVPKRIRNNILGTDLVYVPPGVVTIGKNKGFENAPAMNTFVNGFYIDVYETTVGEYTIYRKIMQEQNKRVPIQAPNASDPPKKPVEGIHWGQARAMLKDLGKDLPTEAEWEKAARGPKSFPNPWGYGPPMWPKSRHPKEVSEIGMHSKDISPYGVHDMAGNIREWCYDYYAPDSYKQAIKLDSTPKNWVGPKQPNPKNTRVVRGSVDTWDVTFRQGFILTEGHPGVGFRGVLRFEPPVEVKNTTTGKQQP